MMADAGYNPIEMARFFEKLGEKGGRAGAIEQFLSDHPDPGNRIAAISDEVRDMPRRTYVDDETGQFAYIRDVVRKLRTPPREEGAVNLAPETAPSQEMATFEGRSFSLHYPGNWQVQGRQQSDAVTIGRRGGVLPEGVAYGLQTNYFTGDTEALIRHLQQANPDMQLAGETRSIEVAGQPALLNTLKSRSPYGGGEVDVLVTVARPQGLFYIVFIAPKSEFDKIQPTFEGVVRSVMFR
jgi:hypothetical protein